MVHLYYNEGTSHSDPDHKQGSMRSHTAAYQEFRKENYFGSLDGLRAIAILAVIWHHTAGTYYRDVPLLRSGHLGVDFFFAISGFLITTLLLREREKNGQISLIRFYIRRTFRIFPLYYTIILVYVILVSVVESASLECKEFFHNLPSFLTYTSNWFVERTGDSRVIFYFAWSLATEEQFYLVWPWVERFLKGWVPVFVMLAIVAVVQLTLLNGMFGIIDPDGFVYTMIVNIATPICLGVILAHVLHSRRGFSIAANVMSFPWSSLSFFVLLAVAVAFFTESHLLIHVLMALVVGSCVIRQGHWLAKILSRQPLKHIGMVSYGMYLMHLLAYHVVARICTAIHFEEPISRFVLTVLATVGAATLSFRYYESFFQRMKVRVEAKFK